MIPLAAIADTQKHPKIISGKMTLGEFDIASAGRPFEEFIRRLLIIATEQVDARRTVRGKGMRLERDP